MKLNLQKICDYVEKEHGDKNAIAYAQKKTNDEEEHCYCIFGVLAHHMTPTELENKYTLGYDFNVLNNEFETDNKYDWFKLADSFNDFMVENNYPSYKDHDWKKIGLVKFADIMPDFRIHLGIE